MLDHVKTESGCTYKTKSFSSWNLVAIVANKKIGEMRPTSVTAQSFIPLSNSTRETIHGPWQRVCEVQAIMRGLGSVEGKSQWERSEPCRARRIQHIFP